MAKRRASKKKKLPRFWRPAPLKSSFVLTAILGFFISAYWVYPQNMRFGITFMLIFVLMFIASLLSMSHSPTPLK